MMIFKKKIKLLAFAICLFLFSSVTVRAGSATVNLNGASSVIVGNNIEVTVSISNLNVTDGIAGFEAKVNYDYEYLEFVSKTNLASFGISYTDSVKTISGAALDADSRITGSSNLIKLVFKTKKEGSTTISLTGTEVSEGNNAIASSNNPSKNITITPPPSSNANLSSLTVSAGSINFNKDTTSYNINVGSDVTSFNVSATAEDSGAKISGIGTKSLNYGNNAINIVVTAPSGAKKTYTINVNREDTRSKNNNLSGIKLSTGTLNPSFNSNKTSYSVSVPFDITSIKVEANAEDSKSKVSISGGGNLKAGAITTVTIKVTAENGSTKTYTVKVTRGKDPNAAKSTNNNLKSITVNEGILTPAFNKNTADYTLTVPGNIKNIDIVATPEDEAFAKVKIDGPENLSVGENTYKITVTAEDETTKVYTLVVTREEDPNGEPDEPPVEPPIEEKRLTLKSIKLSNGKLIDKFDESVYVYRYNAKKGLKITEALPKNEEDNIEIVEHDGIYTIIVSDDEGNKEIYTLIPNEKNTAVIIFVTSLFFISGGVFAGYKTGLKKSADLLRKKIKSKKVIDEKVS